MIAWWWLVIVGMAAGSLGLLIGACCSVSKCGDCREEVAARVNNTPAEVLRVCPACGEVAGYGRQGWACTNPVCEWMENFEEGFSNGRTGI